MLINKQHVIKISPNFNRNAPERLDLCVFSLPRCRTRASPVIRFLAQISSGCLVVVVVVVVVVIVLSWVKAEPLYPHRNYILE